MLDSIRIVLVGTSHPGNIGAAARAMKTMGLVHLHLVRPQRYPHAEASAFAAGADDVLASASVHDALEDALAGCRLVLGASARVRSVPWPQLPPRAAARELVREAATGAVALLFGCERTGLSNAEMDRCQALVTIPADANYSSLNLAAAVQVLAYELRMAWLEGHDTSSPPTDDAVGAAATADDLERFFVHLEETLQVIGFLDARQPGRVLRRLRRLFARARPEEDEVRILRGILTETQKRVAARAKNS